MLLPHNISIDEGYKKKPNKPILKPHSKEKI